MERVDVAVDEEGILVVGEVVESAAKGEVVSEQVKALLELEVEREILGKALRAGGGNELLLIVGEVEGEAGAGFQGISEFCLAYDGELEKGHVAPGEKAIWSVPGIGAGLLRAEDGTVDIEVESLIGVNAGAMPGSASSTIRPSSRTSQVYPFVHRGS